MTTPASIPTPATNENSVLPFVDRRQENRSVGNNERRQFGNSYRHLSPEAKELAEAIDAYKVQHRRRYITPDELLGVVHALGYQRSDFS